MTLTFNYFCPLRFLTRISRDLGGQKQGGLAVALALRNMFTFLSFHHYNWTQLNIYIIYVYNVYLWNCICSVILSKQCHWLHLPSLTVILGWHHKKGGIAHPKIFGRWNQLPINSPQNTTSWKLGLHARRATEFHLNWHEAENGKFNGMTGAIVFVINVQNQGKFHRRMPQKFVVWNLPLIYLHCWCPLQIQWAPHNCEFCWCPTCWIYVKIHTWTGLQAAQRVKPLRMSIPGWLVGNCPPTSNDPKERLGGPPITQKYPKGESGESFAIASMKKRMIPMISLKTVFDKTVDLLIMN